MTSIADAVAGTLASVNSNIRQPKDRYTGADGLLHCSKCHKPIECIIRIFGETQTVRCVCDCIKAELDAEEERKRLEDIERLRRICFRGSALSECTFAADDRRDPRTSMVAERYAAQFDDFRRDGKGLLLCGKSGSGKTYAASCIANYLVERGYRVLVTTFIEIANELQGMHDGRQTYIDSFRAYDLLVLDDLGAERGTEYMQEQVFSVINSRCCERLPFIVTTNISIAEFSKPDSNAKKRIYERILERCFPLDVNAVERRKDNLRRDFPDMAAKLGL